MVIFMAISLVDTAVPMNDTGYPVARAKHIWFDDNVTLQDKLDNKELGGDTSQTLTEAEYLTLPEEEKLNNSYYLYDIGVHYKNGVAYSRKKPIQLTMEEYKALGKVDPDQEYIVSADAVGILLEASDIGYSNAVSNLPCTTVQGAIDKVVKTVEDDYAKKTDIKTMFYNLPFDGITWQESALGKFYTTIELPNVSKILSVCLGDFEFLTPDEIIQPYISSKQIGIMSNTAKSNGRIRIYITYI